LIAETAGCQAHEEMPLSEEVVVNDGKLQNVFVYLKSIPDDVSVPPPPTEAYELDQVGCQYVPHVVGIQAGRPIRAANSDAATHNVSCGGVYYPGGNRIIAAGSPPLQLPTPEREEIPIMFKCDIHPWMSAKVCVVEHPWFDVSAEDGTFTIADVPPGTYKIEAWQEKYGKARVSGEVVVGPGGHVQVDFNYKP
jgi:plastocyanin